MGVWRPSGIAALTFLAVFGLVGGAKVALIIPDNTGQFNLLAIAGCQQAMVGLYGPGSEANCVSFVVDVFPSVNTTALDMISSDPTFDHFVLQSFWYTDYAKVLALRNESKTYSLIDVAISPTDPDYDRLKRNLQGVSFAEDQGGFMAGIVAGLVSASKRVGVVGGLPVTAILKFVHGFLGGVYRVCPECLVYRIYSPSFSDDAYGRNAADALVGAGCDVVFGAAGLTGTAAIREANALGAWVVGVDDDNALTVFGSNSTTARVLTSAEKRIDTAVRIIVTQRLKDGRGSFQGGTKTIDASLDGIVMSPCHAPAACAALQVPINVLEDQSGQSPIANPYTLSRPGGCMTVTVEEKRERIADLSARLKYGRESTGVNQDGYITVLAGATAPARDAWSIVRPFGARPSPRSATPVAVDSSNRIFVFGGESGSISNELWILDYNGLEWLPRNVSGGPSARRYHSIFVYNDQLMVFGGCDTSNYFADLWAYDDTIPKWTAKPTSNTPAGRCKHASAVVGNRLYVYGGTNSQVDSDELWMLNLNTFAWTKVTPIGYPPLPMYGAAMAAVNTTLYLFGGGSGPSGFNSKIYAFDTVLQTWSVVSAAGNAPPAASFATATTVQNARILLLGGVTADGTTATAAYFSTARKEWQYFNGAADKTSSVLPRAVGSHAALAFVPSNDAGGCQYAPAPFTSVCSHPPGVAVVVFGGYGEGGFSQDVLVMWPSNEPTVSVIPGSYFQFGGGTSVVVPVAVAVPIGVIAIFLTVAVALLMRRKKALEQMATDWQIRAEDIEWGEKIGQGTYGAVYKCTFRSTIVAVKTLVLNDSEIQKLREQQASEGSRLSTAMNTADRGASRQWAVAPGGSGHGSNPLRALKNKLPALLASAAGVFRRSSDRERRIKKKELQVVSDFAKEVRLLLKLRHPNIVLMMGASLQPPHLCLCMELCRGGSLYDLYMDQSMPLPWTLRTRICLDAARGLAYLHSGNPPVIHRDLKSPNILLDENLKAKITDFGLSTMKAMSRREEKGDDRAAVGSLAWMAPEAIRSEPQTEAGDVYSFGVVLSEVASRSLPFRHESSIGIVPRVANGELRPSIPEDTPAPFRTLYWACVKQAPSERPLVAQIIEDLAAMGRDFRKMNM